ncbi:MAG: threonylcarbamoyl-AMP synthase [Bacteroidia bacterium]|nr:threonylcarbamoyl-AMP synthase [Bacteroidia bacterium]
MEKEEEDSCCRIGKNLRIAETYLREGKLVAIPTETVYGLAANAFDEYAVAKIFEVKNRPDFNPLIVHIGSLEQLPFIVSDLPPLALLLAEAFWPGPLTLVLPKSQHIPTIVTAGLSGVAVRMPAHILTNRLLTNSGIPLAAPSANLSGSISPTTAMHVYEQLGNKIPYILDGGPCAVGLESTIVSFMNDSPVILRQGGILPEAIEAIVGKISTYSQAASDIPIAAPGMTLAHYAPKTPLILGNPIDWLMLNDCVPEKIGILSFQRNYNLDVPGATIKCLSPSGDMYQAAQRLYAALYELDASGIDVILAEKFPQESIGIAINDRLTRAATNSLTSRILPFSDTMKN